MASEEPETYEDFEKDVEPIDPSQIKTRKDRPTGSTHIGDVDFFEENVDEIGDATWGEVFQTCCCHTPQEWGYIFIGLCGALFFLYFFLLGLELMGSSAKVLGGCAAGELLGDDTNPVAALMIGILGTVLLQSSSTTTSITVSLVGSGTVDPEVAIYMIMGANIGTSVTNTIVAMGQMGDGDQLERAFAGATVHDMFNFLTVAIFFPLEVVSHYLYHLTKAMVSEDSVKDGEKWEGPIKKIVSPLGEKIIIANKKLITEVAEDDASCDSFYPVECEDNSNPTKKTCKVGLIGCSKKTGECPAFFDPTASEKDDKVSGGVCFVLALFILVVCLIGLVYVLRKMLLGMSTRIIYKATNINGYIAMIIGAGITVLVQSSSITTSTLTPLVGMGVLQLEQMYPLTLGANIGTTVTAIMSSLVSDKVESLQVALAHLFFNISGIIVWYPIPFLRAIPISAARKLGKATRIWKGFPIVYILVMFFLVPLIFLGLSAMFEQKTTAFNVLGAFLSAAIALGLFYLIYWCRCKGGLEQCTDCMANRQRNGEYRKALPDDMDYVKARLDALAEHTGLPEEEEEEEEDEKDVEVGVSVKDIEAEEVEDEEEEEVNA